MQDHNDNKIDLTKYFERFYRTMLKMKIILIVIIVAMIGIIEIKTIFFFHTVYSSQAVFVVYTEGQSNIFEFNDNNDTMFSTFQDLMCGQMMQENIVRDLELDSLNANISLSQLTDTNLVVLKVTSSSPEHSYQIAQYIINNYSQVTDLVISDVAIAIIDTPELASSPDAYPNYLHEGIKGLVIALAIDFVIVLLFTIFRQTIIESDDVKNILHLHNLTKIPYIEVNKNRQQKNFHLLLSNPRIQYSFRQSFHDMRIRLEQEKNKNQYQVFMIGSVLPNEGKSTVAANTAISLAQKGYHVVLVDLDLRNPSIYKILKDSNICGNVVDYLKGLFCFEEIVNTYKDYSMDVIYGVKSYDDSIEILQKNNFDEFIRLLRSKYDYVILDVPPLYMLEDAMIISRYCDSSLIVIKQDYANTNEILDALEELNLHLPHITGTIINQAKPSLFHADEKHYGYGYK